MHDLTGSIKQIDLAGAIRDAGIELLSRGGRWVGLCPFHAEKSPSFQVFQDNTGKERFYCFGCGIHGDAVDLVQRLHGLDFKGALNHLGISRGSLTVANRKKISDAERKRQRRQARQQRERELAYTLGTLIRWINLAKKALTPENLHLYGGILDPLSWYEWGHETLVSGDSLDRSYVLWSFKGFPAIERGKLFRENFDFEAWLRNFIYGEPIYGKKQISNGTSFGQSGLMRQKWGAQGYRQGYRPCTRIYSTQIGKPIHGRFKNVFN
jgi:hypothetical protein